MPVEVKEQFQSEFVRSGIMHDVHWLACRRR